MALRQLLQLQWTSSVLASTVLEIKCNYQRRLATVMQEHKLRWRHHLMVVESKLPVPPLPPSPLDASAPSVALARWRLPARRAVRCLHSAHKALGAVRCLSLNAVPPPGRAWSIRVRSSADVPQ